MCLFQKLFSGNLKEWSWVNIRKATDVQLPIAAQYPFNYCQSLRHLQLLFNCCCWKLIYLQLLAEAQDAFNICCWSWIPFNYCWSLIWVFANHLFPYFIPVYEGQNMNTCPMPDLEYILCKFLVLQCFTRYTRLSTMLVPMIIMCTLNSSCKHIGVLNKNSQNFWNHPFICRKRISSLPTPAQNVEKMLIRTLFFWHTNISSTQRRQKIDHVLYKRIKQCNAYLLARE
jgi:hypothetical protein